jgi:hypothetical protein
MSLVMRELACPAIAATSSPLIFQPNSAVGQNH